MNVGELKLYLFAPNPIIGLNNYLNSDVDAVIIDWENRGKRVRQQGWDTQINEHIPKDLSFARQLTQKPLICRINNYKKTIKHEIETAIEFGADELLLPMVRSVAEVENALYIVNDRISVGILVETRETVINSSQFSNFPLSSIYVGLNDLAIDFGYRSIFEPLIDGTLDRIRDSFQAQFGFGGITHPIYGNPIPCYLLIREMARLHCSFSFLRRSFYRDAILVSSRQIISDVKKEFQAALERDSKAIKSDQEALVSYIRRICYAET